VVIEWTQKALALHQAGRLAEAESLYLQALAAEKNSYPALHLMGVMRLQQGRAAEALLYIERALTLKPGAPETLANYGIALEGVGRFDEALSALERVVKLNPHDSRSWSNRGALLTRLHRIEEGLADINRAVALDPVNADAWMNRGQILVALQRLEEGIQSYDRVLHLNPDHLGALVNHANVLTTLGEADRALQSYERALVIRPDMPEALIGHAHCLWALKSDLAGAIADQERAVAVRPDYPYAPGDLLLMKLHAGHWHNLARECAVLDEGVRAGKRVINPYAYQVVSSSPADLRACARIYTQDKYPPVAAARRFGQRQGRVRLGYVCSDFRAQATMHLAAGLFEQHDRARFEVIGFDNSPEDGSPMRQRVIAAFDECVPIQRISDREAADRIAGEEIDILVNLNGYFGVPRMGVFAHRPAPLQVNYLGFPGTLGADYMDYILADAEVIPPGEEQFYSEKVVRLPGSYQINDSLRPRPTATTRAAHGLREADFVFCHFNSSHKIAPEMFALWLRLLEKVPSSVLWLLEGNALIAANLRSEVARAALDPTRLVFAPPIETSAHLSRLALGDLFLDSLPYNGHTTASDALWAGLPVITCRGTAFAGRVAASLLRAVGLPELITDNLDDYENFALSLTKDRALLQSYREHLSHDPAQLSLFDTARTTRQIEAAYEGMMMRWLKGSPPESFAV
jgi:predicted O-linked N-acetylglucosamine transferase (SPINDLY family)